MEMREALQKTREIDPQSKLEVGRGVFVRRTKNGIPVVTLHYSADPERDPEINPEWREVARKKYTSRAGWDREQEIVDEAGGGELVFAETLRDHWEKIVITAPKWRPDPDWKVMGGFDHGKTNPTTVEKAYTDFDGNIYLCGEYYMPGKSVWQHAPEMLRMPDVNRIEVMADPTVFTQKTQQEKNKEAKAINDLYVEEGVKFLSPFNGNKNDITFSERLLLHWSNLTEQAPTLFIVCRNFNERPQPGLHPWDCPNLLWELLRIRRKKLSAQQLLTQNKSEEIVDKDNHTFDALKYLVMSLPEPSKVPRDRRLKEAAAKFDADDVTSRMIAMKKEEAKIYEEEHPPIFGGSTRSRLRDLARRRR